MNGEMFLARRAYGERAQVYTVYMRTLPRAWRFIPISSPERADRPFPLRQHGVAALDNTAVAALTALENLA